MAFIKPAERMIEFALAPNSYTIVDTASLLSQINRRAYRQGMEFAYDKLEIFQTDPAEESLVRVYTLPNTWVTVNAWVKAYEMWKQQQEEAMESADSWSIRASYRDFKVYYNQGHYEGAQGGFDVNTAVPAGVITLAAAQAIDADAQMDWLYSTFVVPNDEGSAGTTETYFAGILGPDDLGDEYRGLIHAYAQSRARPHPTDPSFVNTNTSSTIDGGLYAEMADVGSDLKEVMDGVTGQNNSPPYVVGGTVSTHEFYPGGSNLGNANGVERDWLTVRAITAGNPLFTDQINGFTALLGLMMLYNDGNASVTCRLHCSPGNYLGVAARPMGDAN